MNAEGREYPGESEIIDLLKNVLSGAPLIGQVIMRDVAARSCRTWSFGTVQQLANACRGSTKSRNTAAMDSTFIDLF